MKKKLLISCTIVCALLLSILAYCEEDIPRHSDEILFRGIPWNVSIIKVREALKADIYGIERMRYDEDIEYELYWQTGRMGRIPEGGIIFSITPKRAFSVAGHAVEKVNAYALYGIKDGKMVKTADESNFVMAEYDFEVNNLNSAAVYSDLHSKLCELYGQPSKTIDILDMFSLWYGDNNTGVYLYGSTNFCYLCYAKTDFNVDLRNLLEIYNNNLISNPDSKDGL